MLLLHCTYGAWQGHEKKQATAGGRAEFKERLDTPVKHIEARHAHVGDHQQQHFMAVDVCLTCSQAWTLFNLWTKQAEHARHDNHTLLAVWLCCTCFGFAGSEAHG